MYRIIDNYGITMPPHFNSIKDAEYYINKIISNYNCTFFNHIHKGKEDWYCYIKDNEQMISYDIIKEN